MSAKTLTLANLKARKSDSLAAIANAPSEWDKGYLDGVVLALTQAVNLIEEEHRHLRAVIQETDDALVMSGNVGIREITNEVLRELETILKEFEG